MPYPLQDTTSALKWYALQNEFYRKITSTILREAGIRPGMHVLDVGCGGGGVTAILAEMVGPEGHVLGIDTADDAISAASEGATKVGLKNVEFLKEDANCVSFPPSFHAIVGRFVLMYATDPVNTLRRLVRCLRPDGVVVFMEPDYSGARSSEPLEFCNKVLALIEKALQFTGADTRMGLKLFRAFGDAGLQHPTLHCAAAIGGGSDFPGYPVAQGFVSLLAPVIEKFALADLSQTPPNTIAQRMKLEVLDSHSVIVFPSVIGAWAGSRQDLI